MHPETDRRNTTGLASGKLSVAGFRKQGRAEADG